MYVAATIVIVLILLVLWSSRAEGYMPYKPDEIPAPRMYLPDPGFYPVSVYFSPSFP